MAKNENVKKALATILLAAIPVIIEKAGEIIKQNIEKKIADKKTNE